MINHLTTPPSLSTGCLCREILSYSWRLGALYTTTRTLSALSEASSLRYNSFMEVFKAAYRPGSVLGDSVAVRADHKSYSYTQLVSSGLTISRLLCSNDHNTTCEASESKQSIVSAGRREARIGIVAKPSFEFVAGVLGTWFSGGVAVPLALSYPESELLHDISMVLSTEDYREVMHNVAVKSAAQFSLIPPVPSVSSEMTVLDRSQIEELDAYRGEDPALVIYTSGTTGKPKGVIHTHRGISAQVQMLSKAWEYTSADKFLHCLPLHHVHGLFNALLAPLYAGVTVPTIYTRLIQGYEAMDSELQTSSASAARQLRLMMCGSSALLLPVMQKWETITGHRLLEQYGMTELLWPYQIL